MGEFLQRIDFYTLFSPYCQEEGGERMFRCSREYEAAILTHFSCPSLFYCLGREESVPSKKSKFFIITKNLNIK